MPVRSGEVVLVCRKCSKKLGGGFGRRGRERLAKGLRRHLGVKKGRKARIAVIETGCFDICPKHRVTVLRGSRPDERLLIAAGTPLADIADRLNLAAIEDQPA
jgi:predicted metal-binding protein